MNRAVYKHLLNSYGRLSGYWFGAVTELTRSLALRVFAAVFIAQGVANVASGDIKAAKVSVLLFLTLFCAGLAVGTIGDLVSIRAENDHYKKLLMEFYLKLTTKDMSFYRDNQTGYLASAFRQYLDSTLVLVRFLRSDVVSAVISLGAPVVVLLFANWRVGLVAFVIVAIQLAYVLWASARANRYRSATHEVYRQLTAEMADDIINIVTVKSGSQSKERQRIADLANAEVKAFWLMRKTITRLDLPRSLITAIGVAAAFYIVVARSSAAPADIGLIVLTMTYMLQIIRSVTDLPSLILRHDDLTTKLAPTLEYLSSAHEEVIDPPRPRPLKITDGAISIEQACFSYEKRSSQQPVRVFDGLNVSISGGERLGVVGLSGMGKSTLASLLMRFDDVTAGSIKIDGVDIREIAQADLRQNIAYVPQEPLLFHRSVKENITYFNPRVSQAELIKAAKAAHAHQFIERLPNGYDTIVGERGIKLSGGQKQRIVIARAIIKRAPIMIFDEATSALDSESEQIIQRALPEIIGRQTAIVIAHRLSTISGLDRIIVIHNGIIEEEGTHAQLLKLEGRYYSLWQKQISG